MSVTIDGGYRSGWVRAILYEQNMKELARSTGTATGGMGGGPGFPITLTGPAPTTPGTYTWNVAWYGNQYDVGAYGPRWTPDPSNPGHGREIVATNSFTVSAPATSPAIALNPGSVAFGNVAVGSTGTLTSQIQNTGTAALTVTNVARCAGTSTHFGWSAPALPLTIAAAAAAAALLAMKRGARRS